MNFCGIICELNPLTFGHEYLFKKAKEITNLPILALMSGNWTQRAEPAIINKFDRASLTLNCGCDVCLELPCAYAISPAQNFAYGAVKALTELKCVSHLAFGCETDNIEILKEIAKFLCAPTQEFKNNLKANLANGYNYSNALAKALTLSLTNINVEQIFEGANNILAIEYLKAIIVLKSPIIPVAIKRCDNGHNSRINKGKYLSASKIRELFYKNKIKKIKKFVLPTTYDLIKNNNFNYNTLELANLNVIRQLDAKELSNLFDYNEGIEFAIKKAADSATNITDITESLSCKRYRKARIARLCLYAFLGLTKQLYKTINSEPCYLKVLAIKNKQMLKHLSLSDAKVITRSKGYKTYNSESLKLDLKAANLYNTFAGLENNLDLKTGI